MKIPIASLDEAVLAVDVTLTAGELHTECRDTGRGYRINSFR